MADILSNYVKFMRGTPAAYAVAKKDEDTLYFISEKDADTGVLYLGEKLILGGASENEVVAYLNDLNDVDTSGAIDKYLLGYDAVNGKWVPMDPTTVFAISEMVGAEAEKAGVSGLVPAPKAGEEGYFLRGDGSWAAIELKESLTRKIVDTYEAIEEYILANNDAEKYIFMVPSENAEGANKYLEYIVLTINNNYVIEQVGDWSVDLSDYATKEEVNQIVQVEVGKLENKLTDEYVTKEMLVIQVGNLKDELSKSYVSVADFNKTVGDLSVLLGTEKSVVERLEELDNRLQWKDIE